MSISATISKVKDVFFKKGLKYNKILQFGAKSAVQCSDFGDDSYPLKDTPAVYMHTSVDGEKIIIGYVGDSNLAKEGEKRIYSLKPNGVLSIDIHLKNDGTLEIGGSEDYAVKYNALNSALQQSIIDTNAELTKISAAISSLGGVYTPAPITLDITGAKSSKVKLS